MEVGVRSGMGTDRVNFGNTPDDVKVARRRLAKAMPSVAAEGNTDAESSSDIRRRNWNSSDEAAEISNIFGFSPWRRFGQPYPTEPSMVWCLMGWGRPVRLWSTSPSFLPLSGKLRWCYAF